MNALQFGMGAVALALLPLCTQAQAVAHGQLQRVASFYGPMPTGVTVSHTGRIIINHTRLGKLRLQRQGDELGCKTSRSLPKRRRHE